MLKEQLNEIQKAIDDLAKSNEQRAIAVNELHKNVLKIQSEMKNILEIATTSKEFADELNLLSLNTAIEAARADMPTVSVISDKMLSLSKNFKEESKNISLLCNNMTDDISKIVSKLSESADGVTNNSATLEEINASFEEILTQID